jgi:hypothetical protein
MAQSAIRWTRDVDTALGRAAAEGRHVLLDFTAAPF